MTNKLEAPVSSCSSGAPGAAAVQGRDTSIGGDASGDMTTCPVMAGSPVSKAAAEAVGLYRDYEGERYHFCCAGCGPAFDSDPATYAASMA